MFHEPAAQNKIVCGFPCVTVGELISSFHSEIRKDEEKIQLSIFSPHLSQKHLRYAYLKQHMHRAHGTSSERLCEGIPGAGEPLPPFLLRLLEPANPEPSGLRDMHTNYLNQGRS